MGRIVLPTSRQIHTFSRQMQLVASVSDEPIDPGAGYLWMDDGTRYSDIYDLVRYSPGDPCGDGKPFVVAPKTEINAALECDPLDGRFVLGPAGSGYGGVGRYIGTVYTGGPGDFSCTYISPWTGTFGSAQLTGAGYASVDNDKPIVVQMFLRVVSGSFGTAGMKWIEGVYPSNYRTQFSNTQIGGKVRWNGASNSWSTGPDEAGSTGAQPIGPFPNDVVDNIVRRYTYSFKRNTEGDATPPGAWPPPQSSRDGHNRMWIGGVKIVDVSADAVGFVPPGGDRPYCTVIEHVDTIGNVLPSFLRFTEYMNAPATNLRIEILRTRVWQP